MQFKSRVILILFLLLLVPAITAADNPYQKIVVINLVYTSGSVQEISSEIRYRPPPNLAIQSGTYRARSSIPGKIRSMHFPSGIPGSRPVTA